MFREEEEGSQQLNVAMRRKFTERKDTKLEEDTYKNE